MHMTNTPSLKRAAQAVILIAVAGALAAQDPRPTFEVASIKPGDPSSGGSMYGSKGPGQFNTENLVVKTMIAIAYDIKDFQIQGGPSWMSSEKYTINARGNMTGTQEERRKQQTLMVQSLLEERFQLKFHRETKEMPIYALTIAKGGPKLTAADCVKFDDMHRPEPPAPGQPRPRYCGNMGITGGPNGNSKFNGIGITPERLAAWLSNVTSRVVLDKTGLTQPFDAQFEYAQNRPMTQTSSTENASIPVDAGPSIFTVLQEKLGLKLEGEKGPVEMMVIDRLEKPTEN
jgi:uncharacterized protein (TIGR03435 family)